MIKKLFLILCALVLCSSSYAGNIKDIKKVIARKNAGCTIPVTADITFEDTNVTNTLVTGAAEGQEFNSGAGGKLAQICVNINDAGDDGTISLRIDSDSDLSDGNGFIEDLGTSATISSSGWVCFPSVTNPVLTSDTIYIIAVMENSGDLKWYADSTYGYTAGAVYDGDTGWTLGTRYVNYQDETFRVYYCD